MSFAEKINLVAAARCEMNSSKALCIEDAKHLFFVLGRESEAAARLEKAAQYAWGFDRPRGW